MMSRGELGHQNGNGAEPRLSRASAGRFSLYLRHLLQLANEGVTKLSSSQLGEALAITDAQVRKDLANLGNLGQPGIGYHVADLIAALRGRLGIDRAWKVVVVGVGNLARALLRYRGFSQQGFSFVGLFDIDASKVGQSVEGMTIHDITRLNEIVEATGAELAVVAVPAEAAQSVADVLASAGIKGIMNFAPTTLRLPPGVSLVAVDLAVQLEQLAFLVHLCPQDHAPPGERGT